MINSPDLIEQVDQAKAERDARAHLICADLAAGRTPDPREIDGWQAVAARYDALGDRLLAGGAR